MERQLSRTWSTAPSIHVLLSNTKYTATLHIKLLFLRGREFLFSTFPRLAWHQHHQGKPVSHGTTALPTPNWWSEGAGGATPCGGQVALDPLPFRAQRRALLPFLPPDVVLLHRVAKIRFLGASYDFGPLGVNVEGITEPWGKKTRIPLAKVLRWQEKSLFYCGWRQIRSPQEPVQSPLMEIFRPQLNTALDNLLQLTLLEQGLD